MGVPQKDLSEQRDEWTGPWWSLAEIANLWARDAVGAIIFVGLMRVVEWTLGEMSPKGWGWSIGAFEVTPSEIVHWGDLFVFMAFIVAGVYETIKWMQHR